MTRVLVCVLAALLMAPALAADSLSLDTLLEQARQGRAGEARENRERLARFRAERDRQAARVAELRARRDALEQRSEELEQRFEANRETLEARRAELREALGGMREVFGVVQQVAADARADFRDSVTQVQYPERDAFLAGLIQRMGNADRLPDLDQVERLWLELDREMRAGGQVARFKHPIVEADGDTDSDETVTRVGLFQLTADDDYLEYLPAENRLVERAAQPDGAARASAEALDEERFPVAFALDPTRGELLDMLVRMPGFLERLRQGGLIGYAILLLGAVAVLVTLERALVLARQRRRFKRQMADPAHPGDNPLGRILACYADQRHRDPETLELKIGEALIKELPPLQKRLVWLKMIAMVAPLMGLLGTVTGMIVTFQSITLFGTGDPKLMAGGISQALVTTVMGLSVAIPTLLLHTLLHARARALGQVLEEQAAGMVAEQMAGARAAA